MSPDTIPLVQQSWTQVAAIAPQIPYFAEPPRALA